jgi:hypothetical protein
MPESPLHRWPRGVELLVLAAAMLACLLPFASKALTIDDPLFVWAAQHICRHPFDFFGYDVNWYLTAEPMSGVTQNPPGTCYYLALAGALVGWSEVALHCAMLLPTWALLWGTYRLAERFRIRPLPAALLTLLTPVTLVCASSVMCDVMMLALWVWTVIVWDRGLREDHPGLLFLGGMLIALTTITKYYGVCLIPLLGVYSYALNRNAWRRWAAALGLAVLLLADYQLIFLWLYGRGGLAGAVGYAASFGAGSFGGRVFRLFEGIGFIGGCVGVAAVPAVLLLPARSRLLVLAVAVVAAGSALLLTATSEPAPGYIQTASPFVDGGSTYQRNELFSQFMLWVVGGTGVLLLAADDLRTRRDAVALLLFLWILGTAVFAMYVNWALNGRSVLPLVPAFAMILVRRLQREQGWIMPAILLPAAALALAVTVADAGMADANRTAARQLAAEYPPPPGQTLWFRGHWGFQYYMQQAGAKVWDDEKMAARRGEILVIPFNNNNHMPPESITEIATLDVEACPWATTMSPKSGAGFYACSFDWRPLPFAFTHAPPEHFVVYRLTADQVPAKK